MPFIPHTPEDIAQMLDTIGVDDIDTLFDEIPESFRTPVIMADLEGSSYKEIADKMGCPLGTVMSRIYRGRKLLREQLREYALDTGLLTA